MKEKKKFKDTKFGQWVKKAGKAAPDVIESVGMALGGPWGTVVAKVGSSLGNMIDKNPNNQEVANLMEEWEGMQELFRMEYEYHTIEVAEITKRWEADSNSDLWITKAVRPIFLLYTLGFVSVITLLDSIEIVGFAVDKEYIALFKALLMTAVVAYFGGRSYEKSKKN